MKDDILKNNCETIYWKTGHSYIKRKVNEDNAIAGFEKSGHFFFNQPLGYGYDDGINSAIQICKLLDNQGKNLDDLINALPKTYQSPTMGPFCKDDEKYDVIDNIILKITELKEKKNKNCWSRYYKYFDSKRYKIYFKGWFMGLIRASSNKPFWLLLLKAQPQTKSKKKFFISLIKF